MKLIVGLGNPDQEYQNTRHNLGFMVIDNYLKESNWQTKYQALYTTLNINNEKVIFLKPLTYMNLSGTSVSSFVNFYKIKPQDILVIQDDLDLPVGKYRLKINSSSGGHNGIKNIIECLGTNEFLRLKVGISKNNNIDTKDYVLGKLSKEEQTIISNLFPTFNEIIDDFIHGFNGEKLMNKYNGGDQK